MKKKLIMAFMLATAFGIVGCGAEKDSDASIIGGADGPTSIFLASSAGEDSEAAEEQGDAQQEQSLAIPGTWQTASIGYVDGDDMQPEYYVQFTDTEINYGHMKDGEFDLDYSDPISMIELIEEGRYKVQAQSAAGVQYTYQTAEGDVNVLEYYGTWNEDEYSENYSGGASLSKCD